VLSLAETKIQSSRQQSCRRRVPTEDYAASCFELVDASRPGKDVNTRTVETHIDRCSSNSYLARSISTFFLAANSVQTRKHADERVSMYSLRLDSNNRSRSPQIGQSIPDPRIRMPHGFGTAQATDGLGVSPLLADHLAGVIGMRVDS